MPRRRDAAPAKPIAQRRGARQKALRSPSGYTVTSTIESASELITLRAPDGRVCLKIALLPEGPVVEVLGQELRLASAGELRLDCERLTINARKKTSLRTGALEQTVAGDVHVRAGGVIDSEGHAQRLKARLGDIALQANDDVCLDGERVRLNSPKDVAPKDVAPNPWLALRPSVADQPARRSIWADDGPPKRRKRK